MQSGACGGPLRAERRLRRASEHGASGARSAAPAAGYAVEYRAAPPAAGYTARRATPAAGYSVQSGACGGLHSAQSCARAPCGKTAAVNGVHRAAPAAGHSAQSGACGGLLNLFMYYLRAVEHCEFV